MSSGLNLVHSDVGGITSYTQSKLEVIDKLEPVVIAMHPNGLYGFALGHDFRYLCPDEDDDEGASSQGVTQSKQGGGITYYRRYATSNELQKLDMLSHTYVSNPKSKKEYNAICEVIVLRGAPQRNTR